MRTTAAICLRCDQRIGGNLSRAVEKQGIEVE
jgi:hypothetical protein